MFFWHWIIVQWIERNRIYFAVLRMGKPTNFSQFNFALFRSFWYIFPHRHGCYAFSKYNSLFSTQNHNQPATTLNWAKLDTFQACEICLFSLQLFDWNAAPKTCTRSPVQTHFLIFFFLQKSKGKRTPSHPNRLSCAHAQGVMWHIRAGEEQRFWKLRQISHPALGSDDIPIDHFYHHKMLSIFICTFP